MQFGGRAYGFEDIGRIGALGLSFAELNLIGVGDQRVLQPKKMAEEASRWGLQCLVHGPNEGDPRDTDRLNGAYSQDILKLIEACRGLSARLLTVHFWLDGRFIPDRILAQKRQILCRIAREGARKGVQVCLENLSERPEDLRPLLASCPELGITLDIGHGQILTSRNRALDIIERWPERIRHVHAHDNLGGDHVDDDLHLPIGEGIIQFPVVFRALVGVGYQGTVTLEVPFDHLASSVERLRRIVDDLKSD